MSTRCLLDPNVRIARLRRATASLEIANAARRFTGHDRVALQALHVLLEETRKDHSLSAEQKDARFRALMRRQGKPSTPIL